VFEIKIIEKNIMGVFYAKKHEEHDFDNSFVQNFTKSPVEGPV